MILAQDSLLGDGFIHVFVHVHLGKLIQFKLEHIFGRNHQLDWIQRLIILNFQKIIVKPPTVQILQSLNDQLMNNRNVYHLHPTSPCR